MYRPVVILSAVLVAATPNLAPAGTPVPGKAETAAGTVALAGLDLSTTAGMAQAQKRLTVVAERLCRKFRDDRKAADWATYVDCVHDTLASALEKVMTTSSSIARN